MSLETLAQKLVNNLELRRQFAADPRSVLGREGLDSSVYQVPERMSLAELDQWLAIWSHTKPPALLAVPDPGTLTVPAGPHRAVRWAIGTQRRAVATGQPLPAFARREGDGPRRSSRARKADDATEPASAAAVDGTSDGTAATDSSVSATARADPAGHSSVNSTVLSDVPLADAWEATFRPPSVRALLRTPEFRRRIEEAIIVEDDRRPIENTDERPFRWICSLVVTAANGTRWQGTGWLVGPRTIITAGHVVYMPLQGGWVSAIEVYPASNGEFKMPAASAGELHSVEGWISGNASAYDYGAITLAHALQEDYGFFGFAAYSEATLSDALINIAGYPTDKPMGTMWGNTRRLGSVGSDVLSYELDTFGGMSGAPLVHWDANDYTVVGIHNYGDVSGNLATRISRDVFSNLQLWRSLDSQTSSNTGV